MNPGIIALYLNGEQMKRLLRQFAIQRAISDIGLREGILYISVQDTSLNTLAHTDPTLIGRREEDPFLKNSLQSNRVLSRHYQSAKGEEIFEVVKSFSLKDKTHGADPNWILPKGNPSCAQPDQKECRPLDLLFPHLGDFSHHSDLGEPEPAPQKNERDGGSNPIGRETFVPWPS